VPERDEDLRSEAFFAAERFPEVRFEATRFESLADGALRVVGQLTMKGHEREIEFDASLGGPFTDHRGNARLAMDLRTTVNRLEFGIDWDEEGPGGAKMASHDVDLALHLGMRRIDPP
jgi:polyisoprenoid-binding protein YceI